jgi:uncharacterized repeat protein (TIGR01451 family)
MPISRLSSSIRGLCASLPLLFSLMAGGVQVAGAASTTGVVVDPASTRPVARVVAPVDVAQRVVLPGHVVPAIRGAADLGRLSPEAALRHLIMVLRPGAEQDHALQSLLDRQLDKGSPSFHKWLQPEEFGNRFGVADEDIAKVTAWMRGQGLTVERVAKGKRFIQFSGSVDQVEKAFQVEMHTYNVNGKARISNSSDISVPAALRTVIAGVPTLNNFFKRADFQPAGTLAERNPLAGLEAATSAGLPGAASKRIYNAAHGQFDRPNYTNGTTHFVGAGDFATIYNTAPLLSGGFDGTGISIGVVGRTDIHLEDVQMYRQFFSLKVNDPIFVVAGEDPGIVGGDDGESYLDVEVSGGAAPGATVKFVTSTTSLTSDGVDLSAIYIVDNNLTDIVSDSYGLCEAFEGTAELSFYANLWGQAAAQGQTVFVSTGDDGPAGCDDSNSNFSTTGYAVSGESATPFNVAVGGTLFADTAGGPWWGTTATASPPFSSALGYIPEVPWNEAKGSGATGAAGLWSGSGGISAYFTTPPWQHGFGVPASDPAYPNRPTFVNPSSPFVPGPHRYLPDLSLAAAAQHDGTLYCGEGICQLSSTNTIVNAGIVGGTSVSTPTMAGVQALINQFNGGRQGMANYVYYALADAQHTAGLDCNASHAGSTLDANCAFRDVTTGNDLICSDSTCTAANKIGWTAAAGYDLATGLGSPNAAKLASLWNTVTFNSSTTTLSASQTSGLTHGQSVTLSGTVSGLSGTPTGTVTFIPSSGALGNPTDPNTGAFLNPAPLATLDGSGHYSIPVANLPAGTYSVVARYGGDGTFAASISAPVVFTISAEGTTVTIAPNAFNGTTCVETSATTFSYGSYVWTDVTVAGSSGQGVPTGTVMITDNGNPLATTTLDANGAGHFLSGAIPTTSCVFGFTIQDSAPLTFGTHVLGASYSGDSSFGAASATPVTVTITPTTLGGALATSSANIASAGNVQLTFTLTGLSGAGPGTLNPTGTVTFTDNTTSTVLGTATLNPTPPTTSSTAVFGSRAVLTTTGITTAGANSIVASWPGNANYAAVTSSAVTVTVQGGTSTSLAVTSNANPSTVGGRPTWTATMTPTTVTSGTVGFYDGNFLLGTGTVGAAHTATFRPAATVNLPAGVHTITAVYQGNATFNSSTSAPFAQTFNQTATTVQLTAKNNGIWGQQFTMGGALGLAGTVNPPASGTLQFIDGASPLGSPQPFTIVTAALGGLGIFQAQMGMALTAGTHTLTAQLTDPNYTAPVSNAQIVTVGKATPVVTATGGSFLFNGSPRAGSGSATGGAGESLPVTLTYTGTGGTTYGPTTTAPTAAGTYQVVAHTDGDGNNNAGDSAPAALTITAPPDLAVTMTDGVTTAVPGGSVTYTITVTNIGGLTASGATVADTFPAVLTCTWTCTGSGGATCTASGSGNINDTVNLPVSAAATYTAACTIAANATGSLSNTAAATLAADTNTANNSATDTDSLTPQADLAITKTDGVTTATAGGSVTYTITASNAGPSNATGATVADTFPASLTCTWTCTGAGGGTCTASGSGNINGTVNLPSGGSVTYTASCTISAAATGTLSNTATVTAPAGVTDPTPGNNSATDTDSLGASADLAITKTDGVTAATPGGSVTYTITASNAGPSNATGATVADTFPASLTCTWTCVGAGGGTCTASGSGNINGTVNLPAGGSVTYTASCTISASVTGSLSNTATVTAPAGVTDPTPGNNSATDTDSLGASADLAITKTDGVTAATPGGSVTYTITASNAGPSNATGATVADTFPASLTCTWTCVGAGGGTCTASGSGNINGTVNLPSGGSVTYTASCTISAAATGTLSNTATVTAPAGVTDPTPGNNSATDTDSLGASADLAITKTDGVTTATPGGSVTYTITASNAGPSNATGATVADTFPASLTCTWTCVGAGSGTCTASGSGNINGTVNLPSGGSVTYTASCTISAAATGTLSNTATVTAPAGVTDPTPGNNSATDTDTLGASADLSVTKTDGVTTATPGGSVTYTITASNAGPSNAPGATVADTFPASLTCTWTCTGAGSGTCTASGSGNLNDTVNLPSGGSVTYTASCTVSASATGTLANTATVTAPAGVTDPNPGNNSATDTDTLGASADLAITNTDGATTATAGGPVTYTITASNAGPSNATGATVTDTFPASLTCTWTCTGAGGTCTASGSGNINDTVNLPSGGSVTYTASCTISAAATGTLSNTATVTAPAGVTDPTPGNNSATDTDTLQAAPGASVSGTKAASAGPYTVGGNITYTIILTNNGAGAQGDNPGNELTDTLPSTLTLVSATATSGTAATAGNTATWNGAIPAGGTVTITITATILPAAAGTTVSNQATISFDSDGNGTNDATAQTDDPGVAGTANPTAIQVGGGTIPPPQVPTLSSLGLALLALALAGLALAMMRRRKSA